MTNSIIRQGFDFLKEKIVEIYDEDPDEGMIVFNVDSPTKKDPDRVLTFQLDIQYLGDDYV